MPRKRSISSNAPRIHAQERLLSRFYEPLILLYTLGRSRREHQPANFPRLANQGAWPFKYTRRLFLNGLEFLCDYDTGGDSVTAISIEHTPQRRIFWIAANVCPAKKISPFLNRCLSLLKNIPESPTTRELARDDFLAECVHFARRRIKAYFGFLNKLVQACAKDLERQSNDENDYRVLLDWLQTFQSPDLDPLDLCKLAYNARRCESMRMLEKICGNAHSQPHRHSLQANCKLTRHYLGRLGQYVKTVNMLFECSHRMSSLLDDFEVRTITPPSRTLPPPPDGKTNLDSIAKRMLPARSPDLPHYQQALSDMDMRFGIYTQFMEIYCDENFKPRVHAEVQILDFFYNNDLQFEDSDTFIACSKPACYCCSLYFGHHPLRPVAPASHQTIHRNWRPPDPLPNNNTQRDILNKMNKDIRAEVLHQIDQRRPNSRWHPDSTTGITQSILQSLDGESPDNLSDLSDELEDLDDIVSNPSEHVYDEEPEPETHEAICKPSEDDFSSNEPELAFDYEEDSDQSGGVPLPQSGGNELVDDDENFWGRASRL